jgi:hypothetical protein
MFGKRLINAGVTDSNESFNTVLYNGNGSTQSITGVGFKPGFVWIKRRNSNSNHKFTDIVRGKRKALVSNAIDAETTDTNGLTAFGSDGFTLGSDSVYNNIGGSYVAWCWKARGAAVTNTDGSITSEVSANVNAGFSVVKYTGNQLNATIGHGLDTAPRVIIAKSTTVAQNWAVYHYDLGTGKWLMLNGTTGSITENIFGGVHPSATTFSLNGNVVVNASGSTNIAYCFAENAGFSKFGSYTGNGSSNGPTITTDFEPAFVMVKSISGTGRWFISDNKTGTSPIKTTFLVADAFYQEGSQYPWIEYLGNGFRLKKNAAAFNAINHSYIYMAFANQF